MVVFTAGFITSSDHHGHSHDSHKHDHSHSQGDHSHSHEGGGHGHAHELMTSPGNFTLRDAPLVRTNWSEVSLPTSASTSIKRLLNIL